MPRIAVVRDEDEVVVNIIVAEVSDPCQDGCYHVDVDNTPCGIGWKFDPVVIDFLPPPEPEPTEPPAEPAAPEA
jgi:hypothetical protein